MNYRLPSFFALCFFGAILWAACSDSGVDNGDSLVFPEKEVSYAQHVQPYFNLYCASSGCHDNQSSNRLKLTSYFNTTANPGVVIPGDPGASLLVQKINVGGWEGTSLPHDVTVPIIINENQYMGIRTWIKEGANNN